MGTRMICDKCKKTYQSREWRGFMCKVETEYGQVRGFHICKSCAYEFDLVLSSAVKKFLKLKPEVVNWVISAYIV